MEPQILGEEHADHVVERVTVNRISRIALATENFPHFLLGRLYVECNDLAFFSWKSRTPASMARSDSSSVPRA